MNKWYNDDDGGGDLYLMIMIIIMTSGWGLQQRPTSPITKKIQYTKNENVQWSSAKVTHELSQNEEVIRPASSLAQDKESLWDAVYIRERERERDFPNKLTTITNIANEYNDGLPD